MKSLRLACLLGVGLSGLAHAADYTALAQAFGAREGAVQVRLSPDGDKVAFLAPAAGARSTAMVADIATGKLTRLFTDQGTQAQLSRCEWKSETRLICFITGISGTKNDLSPFTRVLALDTDGTHPLLLGQHNNASQLAINYSAGDLIDLLPDDPGGVLMSVDLVPEDDRGTRLAQTQSGVEVERVNVTTSNRTRVEPPKRDSAGFFTDDHGHVRGMMMLRALPSGYLETTEHILVRPSSGAGWQPLMDVERTAYNRPRVDGFDEAGTGLFILRPLNGHRALFHRELASGTETVAFSEPAVDVDAMWRVGKYNRPVAVSYVTDKLRLHYLDPAYEKLADSLTRALPDHPGALVLDESWDGTKKLVFAGSDVNPGRFYRYDSAKHELNELLSVRPALPGVTPSPVASVTFPARDGTRIPAYLTLPPGKTSAKGLPVVVMPHGGPSSRDVWGFDWLPQFFAQAGYAVLQPNYRGSAGFGENWFQQNGFQSWRTAMGDINDGARWLVSQGADGKRLAIVGWSYGGYAALQANVLEPGLYKAAVAVAPVTDLPLLLTEAENNADRRAIRDFIGAGPHVVEGSPALNAAVIKVPVLMFQGTRDLNVDPAQAAAMDAALARAGKQHELIIYPGLDHQLADSTARADLLKRSADFLAANMPAS